MRVKNGHKRSSLHPEAAQQMEARSRYTDGESYRAGKGNRPGDSIHRKRTER